MMNDSRVIRIGILGAARVAPYALIEPAKRTSLVSIEAVASRSLVKARSYAALHGIPKASTSYSSLLRDDDLDAVYIALPPALHTDWTLRALEHGKHVLCEKPLAINARLAATMAATARKCDRVLQEGAHTIYSRTLRRQRELTRTGILGRVVQVTSTFRHPNIPMRDDDFRLKFELGGGAALDLGCYAVTCLRYVADEEPEVREVWSECGAPDVDCWMRARLTFPSGAIGTVECGFRGSYAPKFDLDVECERGWIKASPGGLTYARDGQIVREAIAPSATYELQLAAFAKQIRGERSEALPPEDAVATARVLDGMYEHAGLAKRIALTPS